MNKTDILISQTFKNSKIYCRDIFFIKSLVKLALFVSVFLLQKSLGLVSKIKVEMTLEVLATNTEFNPVNWSKYVMPPAFSEPPKGGYKGVCVSGHGSSNIDSTNPETIGSHIVALAQAVMVSSFGPIRDHVLPKNGIFKLMMVFTLISTTASWELCAYGNYTNVPICNVTSVNFGANIIYDNTLNKYYLDVPNVEWAFAWDEFALQNQTCPHVCYSTIDSTPCFTSNQTYTGNSIFCNTYGASCNFTCTIGASCYCYFGTIFDEMYNQLNGDYLNQTFILAGFQDPSTYNPGPLTSTFPNYQFIYDNDGYKFLFNSAVNAKIVMFISGAMYVTNYTGSYYQFYFNSDLSKVSFPYFLTLLDNNGINTLEGEWFLYHNTTNYCDNHYCLNCDEAYDNFNCLASWEQAFVILTFMLDGLFYIILFLIAVTILLCIAFCCFKAICFIPVKRTSLYNKFLRFYVKNYVRFTSCFKSERDRNIIMNRKLFSDPKFDAKIYLRTFHPLLYMIFGLSMIISIHCCQSNVNFDSTQYSCFNNGMEQTCTITFSETFYLTGVFNPTCFIINDNLGNPLATGTMQVIDFTSVINYNTIYYTSEFLFSASSAFRCFEAGNCPSNCNSLLNRTANGELKNPILGFSPGYTNCWRTIGGLTAGCLLNAAGCTYSGSAITPIENSKASVSQLSGGFDNGLVQIELNITAVGSGTSTTYVTLSLGQSQSFMQETGQNLNILVSSLPSVPLPNNINYLIQPDMLVGNYASRYQQPTVNSVGDIMTNNPSALDDPNLFNSIIFDPAIIGSPIPSGKTVTYNNAQSFLTYVRTNPVYSNYTGLPQLYGNVYLNYAGNNVVAYALNPGNIELTLSSTSFQFTRFSQSCVFTPIFISVAGCCDCFSPADLIIDMGTFYQSCSIVAFTSDFDIINPVMQEGYNTLSIRSSVCSQSVTINFVSGLITEPLVFYLSLNKVVLPNMTENYNVTASAPVTTEGNSWHWGEIFNWDNNIVMKILFLVFATLLGLCLLGCFIFICYISISTCIKRFLYKKVTI